MEQYKDKTINIKSAKENWNREEVISLLIKICAGRSIELDKWIKQNL